jgi:hypothetical protein
VSVPVNAARSGPDNSRSSVIAISYRKVPQNAVPDGRR